MRTAEEMYEYCVENGYGSGFNRNNSIKHFKVIEAALQPNEDALSVFIGLHNYQSMTKHDNNFAYALTNKRIIMGQKKVIGENCQIIAIENVSDITFSSGLVFGIITIDSFREKFNVAIDKVTAKNIYDVVHNVFYTIKNNNQPSVAATQSSAADQLIEMKKLLDLGIITEDEFQIKKKQILGI